jgi:hypothetical protein
MNTTEIATLAGAVIAVITFISGVVMWWVDLKLKPIRKRLDDIEKQNTSLAATMSQIVDGLLSNDQIPRR